MKYNLFFKVERRKRKQYLVYIEGIGQYFLSYVLELYEMLGKGGEYWVLFSFIK